MSASIPRGFVAKLIGSDGFVDRKIFSAMSAAINYVTGEGLKNFEGDVERAEVISPTGELVWHKSHLKTEGLYWEGRPSTPQSEMLCDDCKKVTLHYVDSVDEDKFPWLRKRRTRCKECGHEKIRERIPWRS
jgi:hypothetical protein